MCVSHALMRLIRDFLLLSDLLVSSATTCTDGSTCVTSSALGNVAKLQQMMSFDFVFFPIGSDHSSAADIIKGAADYGKDTNDSLYYCVHHHHQS